MKFTNNFCEHKQLTLFAMVNNLSYAFKEYLLRSTLVVWMVETKDAKGAQMVAKTDGKGDWKAVCLAVSTVALTAEKMADRSVARKG